MRYVRGSPSRATTGASPRRPAKSSSGDRRESSCEEPEGSRSDTGALPRSVVREENLKVEKPASRTITARERVNSTGERSPAQAPGRTEIDHEKNCPGTTKY